MSKVQTAIVAAMLESVDRIGPTTCVITLDRIADVRKEKKDKIAARAAEIMKGWNIEQGEQVGDISTKVEKDARRGKVIKFGPDRLQAGPAISKSDKVIIVEGRADIVNLLGMNIENTIAVDGTRIPQTVINLCKNREVTALLDGDKGGDMILKELLLNASIEYVARAPIGKEIEEMKYDEVKTALKNK
ncbi:MAG: toprim domain-containing protein, partial [Cyclobacteriaceae bacterium]|nr:toprim domain-containing protein [Cyclobacteriaceae bacterium]